MTPIEIRDYFYPTNPMNTTAPEGAKHTPEPWRYQEHADTYTHIIRAGESYYVCGCGAQDWTGRAEANARRIVQCVNACAGIPDPAAFISKVRDNLAFIRRHEKIEARHEETGYKWCGERKDIPDRYHEVSNEFGISPEEWDQLLCKAEGGAP